MRKLIIGDDSIRICGANSAYILRMTLIMIALSMLAAFVFTSYALLEPFAWYTPILWLAMACLLLLIVLMPKLCWQAFNACTTVDRVRRVVTVRKGNKTNVSNDLGEFEKIIMQPVLIPRGGLQYHAYLIGARDRFHLDIVAGSRSGLKKALQPVAEFLAVPIEEANNIEAYNTVLSR